MALMHGKNGIDLLKALGIDTADAFSAVLTIRTDSVVTLDVGRFVRRGELDDLEEVLERYWIAQRAPGDGPQ